MQAVRDGLVAYNVGKVPKLLTYPHDDLAVFLRDAQGDIQGGIFAEMDWGMVYVDLLWVSESLRGQHHGKALLQTIEQTAYQKGVPHVYLMTTSFQALPFYRHMGYEFFGTLVNRPHGHDYYYLKKINIQPVTLPEQLPVIVNPPKTDVRRINHGLRDYCEQFVDCTSDLLVGFIRDDSGQVKGGIVGSTYWDWYDLRYFWVHEDLRGQGYGKHLLALAEAECHKRGMIGIVCDTADFQALPFYQSHGFEIFATLPDRPPKHESYFLKKILSP